MISDDDLHEVEAEMRAVDDITAAIECKLNRVVEVSDEFTAHPTTATIACLTAELVDARGLAEKGPLAVDMLLLGIQVADIAADKETLASFHERRHNLVLRLDVVDRLLATAASWNPSELS